MTGALAMAVRKPSRQSNIIVSSDVASDNKKLPSSSISSSERVSRGGGGLFLVDMFGS
jgi:hypothetical protein